MSSTTGHSSSGSMLSPNAIKGTLKSEQLIPLLDYLLKKELEKLKIAEFIENLQHLQDKFDYMDKLESLRIDDEVQNIKLNLNQCTIDLQNTVTKFEDKDNRLSIEENIYRIDVESIQKDIEEIKKEQKSVNAKLENVYDEQNKIQSEQESSRDDIESIKKVQQFIKLQQDTMTGDQRLLKIEQDKLQHYRQEFKTELESNKAVWGKIMELQQNALLEREKMRADLEKIRSIQKTMAADQGAHVKALKDQLIKDQDCIAVERENFKLEYLTLKEELDKTKTLLHKVLGEQDLFKKECEKMIKYNEQQRINDEKERMRLELEKMRQENDRIQKEPEKLKDEMDKLLFFVARQQYGSQFDMAGPSSSCVGVSQRRDTSNIRPLLAIKPSDDSELPIDYDNVTPLKVQSVNDNEDDETLMTDDLPLISSCEDVTSEDVGGEDDHDSEELRRDPAIKISKKELYELHAELNHTEDNQNLVQKQDQAVQNDVEEQPLTQKEVVVEQVMEEQQEEEPLFSDRIKGLIQYQLQQHVQLLAQTYVLTATCNDDPMKKLTKESKAMIVELNNFADTHGPKSTFAVKNLSHSKILINSWPVSATEEEILEERYLNESKIGAGGRKFFPENVVKVISESAVFMYSDLLPLCANLQLSEKVRFTSNEDALLVTGLREMESEKYELLNVREKAQLINNCLLPGRSASQIFNRIRNANKENAGKDTASINCNLKKYLINKTFPPSPTASWTQDLLALEPTPPTQKTELPPTWRKLLKKLMHNENFRDFIPIRDEKIRSSLKVSATNSEQLKRKAPEPRTSKEKVKVKKNKLMSRNSVSGLSDEDISSKTTGDQFVETERIPISNSGNDDDEVEESDRSNDISEVTFENEDEHAMIRNPKNFQNEEPSPPFSLILYVYP